MGSIASYVMINSHTMLLMFSQYVIELGPRLMQSVELYIYYTSPDHINV